MANGNIKDRIRELIGVDPVSVFAKKCGISESLLRQYLAGSVPGLDKARQIAEAGGVTLDWLASGTGPMKQYVTFGPSSKSGTTTTGKDDNSLRPLCLLASGPPHSVRRVDVLCFTKEWIRTEFHAEPEDICMLIVETVNMEPLLKPGNIILVDHRIATPESDGVYVLKIDEWLRVLHVQTLPGDKVRVFSNNPAYEPYEINVKTVSPKHFAVLGRVIWAGKRI